MYIQAVPFDSGHRDGVVKHPCCDRIRVICCIGDFGFPCHNETRSADHIYRQGAVVAPYLQALFFCPLVNELLYI